MNPVVDPTRKELTVRTPMSTQSVRPSVKSLVMGLCLVATGFTWLAAGSGSHTLRLEATQGYRHLNQSDLIPTV